MRGRLLLIGGLGRDRRSGARGLGASLLLIGVVAAPLGVSAARAQTPAAPAPLVRLPFPREDGSLTPYTFELGYPLVTLVYDTLLWRDNQGVAQPWLAHSVTTSPDSKKVTIQLEKGARWQDGVLVTAADVAFTFAYVGSHPHPRFTPELEAVKGVQAPDDATVVITLRHPSPGFPDQPLADMPILPAHLWHSLPAGKLAPDGLPVGSGPYRLVEHIPSQSYRFEANAGYFRGPPAVQTVEVPIITDADQTFAALEQDRVDMVPVSIPAAQVPRFGLGFQFAKGASYLGTVVMFNVRQAPFDRPAVRQALARALDLDRIRRAVGDGVAADRGYLHPDSPWAATDVLHTFDQAAAGSALAGLNLGPITVLAPDNDPDTAEAGRQVALAWQRAGLTADVKKVGRDALAHAVGEDGSQPTFSVAMTSAPALASYDPDALRLVFGSDPRAAQLNFSGYRSPAFDDLAARVAATPDPSARRAAVAQELRLLATDLPVVPLFFSNGSFAYRPAIFAGWTFVKGTGILDKRSFLAGSSSPVPAASTTTAATAPAPAPATTPAPIAAGSSGSSWLGWGALAAVGVAVVIGAVAFFRR